MYLLNNETSLKKTGKLKYIYKIMRHPSKKSDKLKCIYKKTRHPSKKNW